MQMVAQKQQHHQRLEGFGRKYMGMAVISEVSRMTPENIRLSNITIELGAVPVDHKKSMDQKKKGKKDIQKMIVLEGIILVDSLSFEAALANYMVKLKKSPLFSKARIQKKSVDMLEEKEVLRFRAQLDLV